MTTHHGTTTTADAGVEVGATRYEVMFFLTTTDDRIPEFRQVWGELGDSIVIVGGDGLWNCHIHSNQIGASIEAAIAVGKPFDIRVTDLFEQVEHIETLAEATASGTITVLSAPLEQSELQKTAVIAVSVGSGVTRLFESLGVAGHHCWRTDHETLLPKTSCKPSAKSEQKSLCCYLITPTSWRWLNR